MQTLGDLYERNAHLYPEDDAFVFGDTRLNQRQYLDRIMRLASAVERSGARQQHRLGVISTNRIEYFEIYGASEWAGYITAAYNFRSAAPELIHLLSDSAPTILFLEAAFIPVVETIKSKFPDIRRFVILKGTPPDWAVAYEAFVAEGSAEGSSFRGRPEHFVHLFYTSGTTGKPKGVPVRNAAQLITAQRVAQAAQVSLLQVTPAFHVGGRGPALGASWVAGKIVLLGNFDPTAFLSVIEKERINVTFMVPPMIQAVLEHPKFDEYDISSLEWVMSASTSIPEPLLRRAIEKIGPVFYIAYGSTETGGVSRLRRSETRLDGTAEQTRRLSSVGHFETQVEGAILDDDGKPLPTNAVGEVCVKSYTFSGYWNNTVATIEAMHGDYLRTGDMGYLDERGYLFLVDRRKDMIISGGENIYSREVEVALQNHPGVQEAAVIGQADEKWGEAVCAIIVRRQNSEVTEEELGAFVATQIAKYKCPKRLIFVNEMPRLNTGKIDKVTLRQAYNEGP
jgi:acyl-CoA synthetase (AMP-forming)/AMP-acid ligase II